MDLKLEKLKGVIESYRPLCRQEEEDRQVMLRFLSGHEDCLDRQNLTAHFTASAWILNETELRF